MAGVSTGVSLLCVLGLRSVDISGTSGVFYDTGAPTIGAVPYTLVMVGHSGISTVSVEMSGVGYPSYSLTNPQSSLSNTINFTKVVGTYTGSYRLVVTTTDATVYYSPYFILNMVTNYFYLTTSYSTSTYDTAGVARSYTVTSPDAWGRSSTQYHTYSTTSSNPIIQVDPKLPENNIYMYIQNDKFGGLYSSNVTFAARDSEGVLGGFGGTIPVSLSRVASWNTASINSSATYDAGNGYYISCELFIDGSVFWRAVSGSSSTSGLVDGYWATEGGGVCKTSNSSGLDFKTKYTHVSGDTRWIITDGSNNYTKDVLLSWGKEVRLTNNTLIGTVTSVVRIGFYTTLNVLLYEQDITLSVTRTAL